MASFLQLIQSEGHAIESTCDWSYPRIWRVRWHYLLPTNGSIERRSISRRRVNRECGDYSTKPKMQIFVFALVAVVAVSANAQPMEETGGPLSSRVCEPGQTKMEDCKSCRCITDGSGYACIDICPKLLTGTCEPGKNFKHYCNSCMCPPNGLRDHEHAGCTRMACEPGVWNEDGTLVSPGKPSAAGPRIKRESDCQPGTTSHGPGFRCQCTGNPPDWQCFFLEVLE